MTPRFSPAALVLASVAVLGGCINPGPARTPLAATTPQQLGLVETAPACSAPRPWRG